MVQKIYWCVLNPCGTRGSVSLLLVMRSFGYQWELTQFLTLSTETWQNVENGSLAACKHELTDIILR